MELKRIIFIYSLQMTLVAIILHSHMMLEYFAYQIKYETAMNLGLGVLVLFLNALGILSIQNLNRQNEQNHRQILTLEKYKNMEEQVFLTRKYRHDLLNHIQIMSTLLGNAQYEKLHAYFLELKKEVEKTRLNFSTGNESLDILFNSKAHEAMKNNITTDIKSFINLPEDFLKNVDAVSIFGNILNNAIEACMAVKDEKSRFIKIELSQDPIDYVFQITNSVPADVKVEQQKIFEKGYSAKSGRERGLGLFIVRETLKRYDGRITVEKRDNTFEVTIEIPRYKFED